MSPVTKGNTPLCEINLISTEKNGLPCIEIRRVTTDEDIIKTLIHCAFHNRPIIVQPTFKDKIRAMNSLLDKGIIYIDQEGEYKFTF